MRNLAAFRDRVREYYKRVPSEKGMRYTQSELAREIVMDAGDLSHKLNGDKRGRLTHQQVRAIVRTLAKWQAITTQAQAHELLELMECPDFSQAEWVTAPLDGLRRAYNEQTTVRTGTGTTFVSKSVARPDEPPAQPIYQHGFPITHVTPSPDGRYLIITDEKNGVYLVPITLQPR